MEIILKEEIKMKERRISECNNKSVGFPGRGQVVCALFRARNCNIRLRRHNSCSKSRYATLFKKGESKKSTTELKSSEVGGGGS